MAKSTALAVIKPIKPPANLKILGNRLAKAKTPEELLALDAEFAGYEAYMRKAGFSQGDMHEINEARMRARWRLGQMLKATDRQKVAGPGRGNNKTISRAGKSFTDLLKRLGLDKNRAQEAQRIGCLPKIELEKIFREARTLGELATITWLVDAGRPYWYKASRQQRHRKIAVEAKLVQAPESFGPFPLIYADPPWTFATYSEKGLEKTPTQHYPTLTDHEIINFEISGKKIPEIAGTDAALLMWCTSSNIDRAIAVMEGWGFIFKSSAVWVKLGSDDRPISGLGLVFRNMHEVILYGTRGKMPGPQYQPPSVFLYPRGKHSAKPPEIRAEIERMYPDFDEGTRLELFSRDSGDNVPGWTHYGFEANAAKEAAA